MAAVLSRSIQRQPCETRQSRRGRLQLCALLFLLLLTASGACDGSAGSENTSATNALSASISGRHQRGEHAASSSETSHEEARLEEGNGASNEVRDEVAGEAGDGNRGVVAPEDPLREGAEAVLGSDAHNASLSPSTEGAAGEGDELVAPAVEAWAEAPRRCFRRPRRYCNGPAHFPVPRPEDAARAERLGLGTHAAYGRILGRGAEPALLAEAAQAGEAEATLLWPVPTGTRGRGFGYVRRGRLRRTPHRGVDIPAQEGQLVRAVNPGIVVYANNEVRGYGNQVVVMHSDDTRSIYSHLERGFVTAGQLVERGEVLGAVGTTGLSRAAHLHFEWRRRAVARNPARRFVGMPDAETEAELLSAQRERRLAAEARLAEYRERAARRRERAEANGEVSAAQPPEVGERRD